MNRPIPVAMVALCAGLASAQDSQTWISRTAQIGARSVASSLVVLPKASTQQIFQPKFLVWGASRGALTTNQEFNLFVLDKNGNHLSTYRKPTSFLNHVATRIIRTSDRGYVMLGYAVYAGPISDIASVLIKVDRNFQPVFQIILEQNVGASYYQGFDVKELQGGDLVVVGTVSTPLPSQFHMYDIAVTRLTSGGALIWSNHYGVLDQVNRGTSVVESANKDLYVAGSSSTSGGTDMMTVLKLDSAGAKQWSFGYGVQSFTQGAASCIALKSPTGTAEELYVAGYIEDPQGFGGRDIHVISIDDTGALLSSNSYGTAGNQEASWMDVVPKPNGSSVDHLYLSGVTDGGTFGQDDTLLVHAVGTSVLQGSYHYGASRDDAGSEVKVSNGKVYMVGRTTDFTMFGGNTVRGQLVSRAITPTQLPVCGANATLTVGSPQVQANVVKLLQYSLPTATYPMTAMQKVSSTVAPICGLIGQ